MTPYAYSATLRVVTDMGRRFVTVAPNLGATVERLRGHAQFGHPLDTDIVAHFPNGKDRVVPREIYAHQDQVTGEWTWLPEQYIPQHYAR